MKVLHFIMIYYCTDMRKHIIYPDCDIKFKGHVTWVGKTSIEAKMHMTQVFSLSFCTSFPFFCVH